MPSGLVIVLTPITIVVILVAIYLAFPKYGPHYTSRLTCPKCGKTFDYAWLPGGSFTVVRFGKWRYMRCQVCRKWSIFDIISTIVKPDKKQGESGDALSPSESN